jgi:hypothetical protein
VGFEQVRRASLLACVAILVPGIAAAWDDDEDGPPPGGRVEYVRVCSLYGAGFYYVPGTDVCLKVGGYVRAEWSYNGYPGDQPFIGGYGRFSTKTDSDVSPNSTFGIRAGMAIDARTQTEYGTLRAYFRPNFASFALKEDESSDLQVGAYADRAFLQFAGFTFGRTQSFYDVLQGRPYSYTPLARGSDTGQYGANIFGYQWQMGNGVSAGFAAEDPNTRRNAIYDASPTAGFFSDVGFFQGPGHFGRQFGSTCLDERTSVSSENHRCHVGDYSDARFPDLVANLRINQSWGYAGISGAAHEVRANAYGNNEPGPGFTGVEPDSKWGFGLQAGLSIKLPMIGSRDRAFIKASYSEGAPCYSGICQFGQFGTFARFDGNHVGAAWAYDAVMANTGPGAFSGLELTKAWSIQGGYEHFWSQNLRTSIYGSYAAIDYNSNATRIFCSSPVGAVRDSGGGTPSFATGPVPGCDPDFGLLVIGSRTIWKPDRLMEIGAEVTYTKLEQNMDANTTRLFHSGAGEKPAGLYVPSDQDVWSATFRWQRNFYP